MDGPVPMFYKISHKVLYFFLSSILTLFCPKLLDAIAHRTKDGPREVCSCLDCYLIFHSVVFRLKCFPG